MKRLTEAWFSFKGIDSRDMGIFLKAMPVRYIPGRNITRKHASGVDGSYAYGDGSYNDARVQLECDLRDESKLNDVLAWLTGDGELIFSDEPGFAYDASIEKEYSRASIAARLTGQRFTVTWTCKPFRRMIPAAKSVTFTAAGTISNPGTAYSLPKITIRGYGDFSLHINTQRMDFTDISGGVVLDSELSDAFVLDEKFPETVLCIENVYGPFFRLLPGANLITWVEEDGANVESVTIEPRWRCL